MHEPLKINGALLKGLAAAVFGGGAAYALALMLPGNAVVTALIGMLGGTALALVLVRREVRLLLNL